MGPYGAEDLSHLEEQAGQHAEKENLAGNATLERWWLDRSDRYVVGASVTAALDRLTGAVTDLRRDGRFAFAAESGTIDRLIRDFDQWMRESGESERQKSAEFRYASAIGELRKILPE